MHYLLGKILQKKYWKQLFGEQNIYDPKKIYVQSTNYNRTIQSAQAQLNGWLQNKYQLNTQPKNIKYFLPPFEKMQNYINLNQNSQNLLKNINKYKTILIHTNGASDNRLETKKYEKEDFLLKFLYVNCPKQKIWIQQNFNSKMGKFIFSHQSVKQALKKLSQLYANSKITRKNAYKFIDSYACMKYLGQKTPLIYQDPYYSKTFDYISIISIYLRYFNQPIQIKTAATNLFRKIVENFKKAINGQGAKLILYSAHDSTIAMALIAMNMTNLNCINDKYLNNINNQQTCISQYPVFASNLIMEVYEQNEDTYTFRIVYNNIPRQIPFCENQYVCSIQRFYDWVDSWKISNSNKQCEIDTSIMPDME